MNFTLSVKIDATPMAIYTAWLSNEGHTKMTGGEAIISDLVGESFSTWDGYITGKNTSLEPYHKIVQSWRTTEFEDSDEDSILEITFKDLGDATEITLVHSNLSQDEEQYKKGWEEYYFEPMKTYFHKSG